MTTTRSRHLALVRDSDDLPAPRGPLTGLPPEWDGPLQGPVGAVDVHVPDRDERDAHLSTIASVQGWTDSSDDRERRRDALCRSCPRPSCMAAAGHLCRRRSRGAWKNLAALHDERAEQPAAELVEG